MSARRAFTLLAAALTALVVCASPASAHPAPELFHGTWAPAQRGDVSIYAESTLLGPALSRVLAGVKPWEGLGRSLNFTWKATKNLSRDACDIQTRGMNLVAMGPIDGRGKELATTSVCIVTGRVVRFVTVFDSAEDWYTGTSTTDPVEAIVRRGGVDDDVAPLRD